MNETLHIPLNAGAKPVLKIWFLIRASFASIIAIGAGLAGVFMIQESVIGALVIFSIAILATVIFFNMLNAVFYNEQLLLTKDSITLIQKKVTGTKKHTFSLTDILYFGFAEQHFTKHPMDNSIVDFTGLAAREKELQYVIDEGNIKLETAHKTIRFGKGLPSWDVEEAIEKVEAFTGKKFSKPKQEKIDTQIIDETEEAELPETEETEFSKALETISEEEGKPYAYSGEFGELIIFQKKEVPASGDAVQLNGNTAESGKYQLNDKQFVMVSNGIVYAVRGFGD
jgi:hypothetical protein